MTHLWSEMSYRGVSSSNHVAGGSECGCVLLSKQLLDGADVDVERIPAAPQVRSILLLDSVFRNRFPVEAPHPPLSPRRVSHRKGRGKGRSQRWDASRGVVI